MNKLSLKDRAKILACLVEGNSMRATTRITGFAKKTVERLAKTMGEVCLKFADENFVNLKCDRIQCDEIWSFVGCKERNANGDRKAEGCGDAWTWVAIDPETKLIPCWYVGDRSAALRLPRTMSVSSTST